MLPTLGAALRSWPAQVQPRKVPWAGSFCNRGCPAAPVLQLFAPSPWLHEVGASSACGTGIRLGGGAVRRECLGTAGELPSGAMSTSNATNIINNVTVYIPECSAHVSASDISYENAQDFQPTQGSYYTVRWGV